MMVGGIRLITYDSRVTRNSGASGHGASAVAAPPARGLASSTTVLAPERARYAAATSPLCPPPTTMAPYVAAILAVMCRPSASLGSVTYSAPVVLNAGEL